MTERKHKLKKPSKGKYTKLKSLKCFEEVHNKILNSEPIPRIVDFIQDENEEYIDVTKSGLSSILSKYKREIPASQLIAPRMSNAVISAKQRFGDGTRELERLDEIYEMQRGRLYMIMELERRAESHNPRVGAEIATLQNIVKGMHDIMMDLGLNGGRDLGTVKIDNSTMESVRAKYGDSVAEALEDPDARGRVLNAISHMSLVAVEGLDA